MTALDQAFIKAYMQKDGPSAEPPDSAKPVLSSGTAGEESLPESVVAPVPDAPAANVPEELRDVLEEPLGHDNDLPPQSSPPTDESEAKEPQTLKIGDPEVPRGDVPAFLKTGTSLAKACEAGASMRQSFDTLELPKPVQRSEPIRRIDPPSVSAESASAAESPVPAPHSPVESKTRPNETEAVTESTAPEHEGSQDTDILSFEESPVPADSENAPPEDASDGSGEVDRSFLPMLQVERYTIPKTCLRLDKAAPSALDRLTDGLTAAMNRRQRVVAIGACRQGEGATTMLLCAAQRLIRRGLKVVIVDAQLERPQLAKQLGLAPEFGWEDVLTGRTPLEEVVIEAIDNGLAVLPCCRPLDVAHRTPLTESRMIETLSTLRENYDLVLIDMDPLDERTLETTDPFAQAIIARLEAVTLVHNVATTTPHYLGAVQRRLAATGIASAGVVENFVPS